ncbi:SDR family oxidoreductase [Nakamurella leprariae]|uniref:SDR family oxidoreductase n=1 Tax=Nakamurella leprariae TaxID=2803911 RepID=A0A938YHI2_9ACTN|nr:SDR family oxidoreductase [Nakamurella leprariae]MBM9467928.1 SDR family oxidoreductase [Nakamurella leprariae]
MDVSQCTVLVTGGASGLGAATAAALVAKGARVVVLDLPAAITRDTETWSQLPIEVAPADVTDALEVRSAVELAAGDADRPLRGVVNCAGIGPSMRILGRSGPHDLDLFQRVVTINLIGSFTVMTVAAEAIARTAPLEDGARGAIVNTASVAAFDGQIGQAAYAASKAGIAGLTLPAARDLASAGIRVNTIAPGIIETPMLATVSEEYRAGLAAGVPFPKRLGRPGEYAELALFLLEHDYVNGETIRLDGALRMPPK